MPMTVRVAFDRMADYGTFFLHDPAILDEDPDDDAAVAASREHLLGASAHRAYLRVGQRAASVNVTLEIWNSEPPGRGSDSWDAWDEVTISCPSGRLMVQNTGNGPVPLDADGARDLALPAAANRARIRAYGADMDTADEVNRIYQENVDAPFDELHNQLRALDGRERYLIQIWPGPTD